MPLVYSKTSIKEGLIEFSGRELFIFLFFKLFHFIFFLLLLGLIVSILIAVADPLQKISSEYGSLITASSTIVLGLITTLNLVVTRQILSQMKEEKLSVIRPMVWIRVEEAAFEVRQNDTLVFSSDLYITNQGRGTAFNVKADFHIPYRFEEEGYFSQVSFQPSPKVPVLLKTFDEFNTLLSCRTYVTPSHNHSKYLTIGIKYEDAERNLYKFTQWYYVFIIGDPPKYLLSLQKEILSVIHFNQRTSVRDDGYDEDKSTTLFNRTLDFRL